MPEIKKFALPMQRIKKISISSAKNLKKLHCQKKQLKKFAFPEQKIKKIYIPRTKNKKDLHSQCKKLKKIALPMQKEKNCIPSTKDKKICIANSRN